VRFDDESLEVVVRAVVRLDAIVVGRIIAVIARRLVDGHEPDTPRAQVTNSTRIPVVDVVELLRDTSQVADPVAVAIEERPDEDLIARRASAPVA
jgi:hypothetical protein